VERVKGRMSMERARADTGTTVGGVGPSTQETLVRPNATLVEEVMTRDKEEIAEVEEEVWDERDEMHPTSADLKTEYDDEKGEESGG